VNSRALVASRWRPALVLLALALVLCRAAGAATPAATLRIDTARSHAEFDVRLLWLRQIHGRFDRIRGTLTWTPAADTGVVEAWIDVNSVHMPEVRYEHWLLAPEFFDAARYPRNLFDSAPVPLAHLARGGPLHGRLTMRGVTRPVDFRMLPSTCPHPRAAPCIIRVLGTVRRSRFGMRGHRAALSDRVQLGLVIVLEPVA
jgi:polyisoprenoid-binding protein YceI